MALPEPGSAERETLIRKLCWAMAITLLVSHIVFAWVTRLPAVTPASNDDALYLLLARSLGSLHYVDQHLVGSPIHAQYPPGYPAALALAASVFGSSLNVAQAVTILFSALALLLIFDMTRRLAGPIVGVLTIAPLVFNTRFLSYAGRVATEAPYMALSFATLWVVTYLPESRRQLVLAGFLAIFAAFTRSIGVSLVTAIIVLWILHHRYRPALVLAGVAGLTLGSWLYWTAVAPNQFTERSYAAVATTTARHFSGPIGMVVTRSENFAKVYLAKSIGSSLETPSIAGTWLDNAVWLAIFVLFGGIGFWVMRRRAPAIPLYFLAYCGVLLLYPYKMTRFLIPVSPLILMATMVGIVTVFQRRGQRAALLFCLVLSLAITVKEAPRALQAARAMSQCNRADATTSTKCFAEDRLAFFAATRFARSTLPKDAAVLTIKEATFYYYTGHAVLHPDLAMLKGGDHLLSFLQGKGIEYVLIAPFVGGAEIIRPLLPSCGRVEVLRDFGSRTMLLKLHSSAVTAQNACKSMRDLEGQLEAEERQRAIEEAEM